MEGILFVLKTVAVTKGKNCIAPSEKNFCWVGWTKSQSVVAGVAPNGLKNLVSRNGRFLFFLNPSPYPQPSVFSRETDGRGVDSDWVFGEAGTNLYSNYSPCISASGDNTKDTRPFQRFWWKTRGGIFTDLVFLSKNFRFRKKKGGVSLRGVSLVLPSDVL